MAKQNERTWLGYMENLSRQGVIPEVPTNGLQQLLPVQESNYSLFCHSIPAMYLVDYTSGKYLNVSQSTEAILGYKANTYIQGGVDFFITKYHPDDLRLFNQQIFPDRLQILKNIYPAEHPDYIFSYTYRLKTIHGTYVTVLQRNSFIKSDTRGNPLLSLGMIINIDYFAASSPVIQQVEKISHNPALHKPAEVIFKKSYYLHEEDHVLSKREKEVLLWIMDGLTSKEIAVKLCRSEKTVIIHRKNMLLKTNTKNVAEMIGAVFKNNLL